MANEILNDLEEGADKEDANFRVLHVLVSYNLISKEDAQRLFHELSGKTRYLPFIKDKQEVHFYLFLKQEPVHKESAHYFLPADILKNL